MQIFDALDFFHFGEGPNFQFAVLMTSDEAGVVLIYVKRPRRGREA